MKTAVRPPVPAPLRRRPMLVLPRRRIFRWYPPLLAVALGGYLFFSRAFAWLHVPGIPIFLGEVLLAVGLVEMRRVSPALPELVRRSPAIRILLLLMGFGLIRLLMDLPEYGLAAARDAAMWYYGGIAVVTGTWLLVRPKDLERAKRLYRRVIPYFLVWAPIAVVTAARFKDSVPTVPDSGTSILSYKPGDFAVHITMAISYLWLLDQPTRHRSHWFRYGLTALGLIGLMVTASKNRGGLLAGLLILLGTLLFSRARGRAWASTTAIAMAIVILALALDLQVDLSDDRRAVSVRQVSANLQSIFDPASTEELQGTVTWRLGYWGEIIEDTVQGPFALTGLGFGVNLADRYGYQLGHLAENQPLRNAHNSHLTLMSRMGLLGLLLWVSFWAVWARKLWPGARRGITPEDRLSAWLLVGIGGILVNAIFDPSLEGPQAAIWAWTLAGTGAAISSPVRRRLDRSRARLSSNGS